MHQNKNKNAELERNDTCWEVKYGSVVDDWCENCGLAAVRAVSLKYYLLMSQGALTRAMNVIELC